MTKLEQLAKRLNELMLEFDDVSLGAIITSENGESIFVGNSCPGCTARGMAYFVATNDLAHTHESGVIQDFERTLKSRLN